MEIQIPDIKDNSFLSCDFLLVQRKSDNKIKLVLVVCDEVAYFSEFGVTWSPTKHLNKNYTILEKIPHKKVKISIKE